MTLTLSPHPLTRRVAVFALSAHDANSTRRWVPLYRRCVNATICIQKAWRQRQMARRLSTLAATAHEMQEQEQELRDRDRDREREHGASTPKEVEESEALVDAVVSVQREALDAAAIEEKRL